jgi:Tfp pilus assembly protein PilV
MTRDRLLHAEGGVSFAEVLVAMALTMIGLAGAMGHFRQQNGVFEQGHWRRVPWRWRNRGLRPSDLRDGIVS